MQNRNENESWKWRRQPHLQRCPSLPSSSSFLLSPLTTCQEHRRAWHWSQSARNPESMLHEACQRFCGNCQRAPPVMLPKYSKETKQKHEHYNNIPTSYLYTFTEFRTRKLHFNCNKKTNGSCGLSVQHEYDTCTSMIQFLSYNASVHDTVSVMVMVGVSKFCVSWDHPWP